ncbi:MAG: IPT/TIG domain-containing protein, partial [Clostridiales bacterium]|nr:IPT/TIG domain-containing protein [Clostridiales bacterium]
IKLIGNSAFQSNNITSLNLSGCTALSTIGYGAFYGNKIIDVDLTSCKNLLSIGGYAFSNNPYVHDFALPDPVIPGYFYSNWIDSEGILHDAVDRVSNLTNSFTRIMPEITDVIERYGPTSGNIEIIIAGKNFENQKNNKKILFNGIETLNYNSWSDTLITIVSPPNPEGAAKIEIPLENNIIYSSPKQFYYTDEDVIPVCGNIFGTWEAGSTYLLICNVTIPENNTLIVNEGVKIIAMPEENIHLSCNGILKGNGTYDNPILFTSANKLPGSWKGISINGTNDNCKFKNCIFEYATTAISLYAWAWGCESHRNASEFINCIIRNNSNNAFSCTGEGDLEWGCIPAKTGACSPLIQYCQIYNNGNNGIELEAWDGYKSGGYIGAKIYNNIIYNNRNGIYCQGDDNVEPKIINNVISKNSFAGINSTHNNFDKTDYNIANNIITNNVTGVINEDTTSIILNNNGFWSNTVDVQGEIEDFSNIFENPLFIDFQNNDFNLQPSSPCINSGSNDFVDFETDFAGRIRIYEGLGNDTAKVDIGAYEFGAPCSQIKMDRTICSGDSIQIGDSIFTQTGKYAVKLSNIFGCDSIVNLYLIVNPTHSTNITEAICQGESIQIGDSIFNQTGKYSVRLSNIFGCDSIVNLDLTINEVDASIIQSDNTLMANALNAKYQWLNCTDEFSIIVGETNQSYTATKSGSYAVEVTQDDCTDTSDCFNIIIESIIENNFGSDLILFPNPTEGLISIDLGFFYNNVNTIIKNISGQVISTNNFGFIREFNLSLEGPNGLYIVEISTKEVRKAKIVIVKY